VAINDVHADYPMPYVWPRLPLDVNRVDAVVVHHTATFFLRPSATIAEELAHIDMIHIYHQSKGWGGFAYHFIVFPSGRSYLVVPLTQWGAHVKGENDHLHAVVVAGDFTDVVPVRAQQEGVAEGIRLVYATLGRRVPIRPHRSWTPTSCPGNTWQSWVPGLTALVEEDEMEMDWETFVDFMHRFIREVPAQARYPEDSPNGKQGEPYGPRHPLGEYIGSLRDVGRALRSHAGDAAKHSAGGDVSEERARQIADEEDRKLRLPLVKD